MTEGENSRRYDLEERTYEFARRVRAFIKLLNKTLANIEDAKQVIRSSGSVASNYIEANEALSKKDFVMRSKICRKEAKESRLFLRLIDTIGNHPAGIEQALIQEAQELTNIFGAIVRRSE
jgi:four helix bundle protein